MSNDEPSAVDLLPDARRGLLSAIKRARWATIPQLAATLQISNEAVRQQLAVLTRDRWVVSNCGPDEDPGKRAPGRPPVEYCLSPLADDLFPKRYSEMALTLFDELPDAEATLTTITDRRLESLRQESPATKTAALRSIYREGDAYVDVAKSKRGYRVIERNCPYLQFATERPLFCSTTVSVLRRLTGCEVVREERFQDGDARCVFHIYFDAPLDDLRKNRGFEHEPEKNFQPRRSAL
jgi:predicted ArsR family transcriptional regulator